MGKFLIGLAILLAVFAGDVSASPGISLKGNGLSFGNLRSEGKVIDGLSLTLGSLDLESMPLDEINGVSLTLFPSASKLRGISVSLTFAKHNKVTGIAMGGVMAGGAEGEMTGIIIGGIAATGREVTGIAIGGLLSEQEALNGFSFAGLYATARKVKGIQIAIISEQEHLNGLSLGVFNLAQEVYGIQVGVCNGCFGVIYDPFPNLEICAGEVNGVQIGLFNCTEQLHGVQIGLINYAGNNNPFLRVIPLINVHF
ncbi:MAG: LA_2272 family surface repeat-containing protein [Nitrospiria bacterium]